MGLAMEVILNRESVMVLPPEVNKATGLARALRELRIAPERVVGVGDAENDEAFLRLCGFSVAVGNAIPRIKQITDMTTQQEHGLGMVEVIEKILAGGLEEAIRVKDSALSSHQSALREQAR
jgi:hypothetical protein